MYFNRRSVSMTVKSEKNEELTPNELSSKHKIIRKEIYEPNGKLKSKKTKNKNRGGANQASQNCKRKGLISKQRRVLSQHIGCFDATYYRPTSQSILALCFARNSKRGYFSHFLVNKNGEIIFADKVASEQFEGSLNPFKNRTIQSFVLEQQRQQFIEKSNQSASGTYPEFRYYTYSKNSKRRYTKIPKGNPYSRKEDFFRFMKRMRSSVLPIKIDLSSCRLIKGFWNENLIEKGEGQQCYLFRNKYSKYTPDLDKLDLDKDEKIQLLRQSTRSEKGDSFDTFPEQLQKNDDGLVQRSADEEETEFVRTLKDKACFQNSQQTDQQPGQFSKFPKPSCRKDQSEMEQQLENRHKDLPVVQECQQRLYWAPFLPDTAKDFPHHPNDAHQSINTHYPMNNQYYTEELYKDPDFAFSSDEIPYQVDDNSYKAQVAHRTHLYKTPGYTQHFQQADLNSFKIPLDSNLDLPSDFLRLQQETCDFLTHQNNLNNPFPSFVNEQNKSHPNLSDKDESNVSQYRQKLKTKEWISS